MKKNFPKPVPNRTQGRALAAQTVNQLKTGHQKPLRRDVPGDGASWENTFYRVSSPSHSSSTLATAGSVDPKNLLIQFDPLHMVKFLIQEIKLKLKSKYPEDLEILTQIRQVYYLTRRIENNLTGAELPYTVENRIIDPALARFELNFSQNKPCQQCASNQSVKKVEMVARTQQTEGNLVKEHEKLIKDMEILLEKLEKYDENNKFLTESLKKSQDEKEKVQSDLHKNLTEVSQVKTELTEQTLQNSQLKQELTEQNLKISQLNQALSSLESQLNTRELKVKELNSENMDLLDRLRRLKEDSEQTQTKLEDFLKRNQERYKGKIKDLEEQLFNSQAEVDRLLKLEKQQDELFTALTASLESFGNVIENSYCSYIRDIQEARKYFRPKGVGTHRLKSTHLETPNTEIFKPQTVHSETESQNINQLRKNVQIIGNSSMSQSNYVPETIYPKNSHSKSARPDTAYQRTTRLETVVPGDVAATSPISIVKDIYSSLADFVLVKHNTEEFYRPGSSGKSSISVFEEYSGNIGTEPGSDKEISYTSDY